MFWNRKKEKKREPRVKLSRAEKKQLAQIRARAQRPKYPQTAQQTIPYLQMYPDGVCRVTENRYSRTVRYYDINYRQAQKSDQQAIFSGWGGVLNIFQPDVHVQYSFINNQMSEAEFEKALIIPPEGDDLDEGREEMSKVLLSQVGKGNNAQQRSKYVTFSVEADGLKSARLRLEHIELQLLGHLKRLGVQAETLDGTERLQIMHGMMHMDEPQTPFLFDWKWLPASGLSTKDFIAPSSLNFRDANRFFIGRKMASVSFLNILASELSDSALVDFLEMETTQVVTMHVRSLDHVEALKMVRSKLSDMSRSKADEQKKAVRAGYDMDILPPGMVDSVESLNELQKKLSNHAERLFLMTFTILHTGNNRRELDAVIRQAKGIAQEKSCQLVPLDFQQEEGFVSSLPLGVNRVEIERSMTTSETAIFMPFVTQELFQPGPGGLCYGINALSGNIVIADRTKLHNGNGVILGKPGSGKSFAGKLMFTQMLLRRLGDGLICDPEGEYHALVNYFKGQIIRISPVSTDYINPLDIDLGYSTSSEAIRLKSEFILSLCELVLDKDSGVAAQQKSIVDRALQKIYAPYMANPEPENMPILGDLYNELKSMSEPEAAQIATALELYVSGSLNVFNHRTNVQLNNRLVCFDIKQLRGNLKKLGMLIVQDQVWLRVTQNRAKRKTTWFFADEFHLLLGDPQTAAYSVEMWKRLRKWGGVPTGITQNVSDLLRSREIQTILENSDFIMLFRQSPDDAKELAERLHISEHQMSYVTQAAEGEGLLIYGNKIIPFINRFPKDTNLYRIMTTKPSEMIQEESA